MGRQTLPRNKRASIFTWNWIKKLILIFKVVKMINNKPNNHEMCLVQGKYKDSTET